MQALKNYLDELTPLSSKTWKAVQPLFTEKKLDKSDFFIQHNQKAREIGFLTDGVIRAYYTSPDGTEYNKHFFAAPCFVGGYASLITGELNQINQQALTPCRVLVANYTAFQKLFTSCPDLERAARILAERFFVQKEQREIELVMLDAEERYHIFQRTFPALTQVIAQYHIASYLGITPTQLSRIRRKLTGH